MNKKQTTYEVILKLSFCIILLFSIILLVATLSQNLSNYIYGNWPAGIAFLFISGAIIYIFTRYRIYKKNLWVFLLHLSILIIIAGSFITHFFGFSGILHLRNNQSSSTIEIIKNNTITKRSIPFVVKLTKFSISYYPGSNQPSSYDSYIEVIDKQFHRKFPYHIYMNHILSYRGYNIYQTAYDPDKKGTILTVSYDPGAKVVFFGFLLISIAFLVHSLLFLKKQLTLIIIAIVALSIQSMAFDLNLYAKTTKSIANEFGKIAILSNGRIQPLDSLNLSITKKITHKRKIYGLNYNQVVLGILLYPDEFKNMPLFFVKSKILKKQLHIKGRYASYNDFFKNGKFIFLSQLYEAFNKKASQLNETERELLKLNDALYVFHETFTSQIFTIFPQIDNSSKWLSPIGVLERLHTTPDKLYSQEFLIFYRIIKALKDNNAKQLTKQIDALYTLQKNLAGSIMPSKTKLNLEILYNHLNIFEKLIGVYTLLGIIGIIIGLVEIIFQKQLKKTKKMLYSLGFIAILIHAANMGLRWYIASHAPWSDAYESIVFIGFSSALVSMLFIKKSPLVFGGGFFAAGMFMLTAAISDVNPQITNMVPVLKSYWLVIHVAFSIISYGFFSIAAILGLLNIIIYFFIKKENKSIEQLSNIIEINIYLGLTLLVIGTIFGAVWAYQSWGSYWSWDPKETWSLISILIYSFILHLKYIRKLSDILLSILAFLGFDFILLTYFGVNFYIAAGLHSYSRGSGSIILFYFMLALAAIWYGLSFYVIGFFKRRY